MIPHPLTTSHTPPRPKNSREDALALAVLSDGRIVAVGEAYEAGSQQNFAVARYNADGTLDASFGGGDGKVTTDFAGSYDAGMSLAAQADGRLVVAGYASAGAGSFALARYDADGTLDASFGGGDGKVNINFAGSAGTAHAVALQPDGKIVAAGYSFEPAGGYNFALARFGADGSLDATFGGGDGKVTTDFAGYRDIATGVAVQVDGKIVVAGFASGGSAESTQDFGLARYTSGGTLDGSFGGGDGLVRTDVGLPGFDDRGNDVVVVQPDGKILVAGYANQGSGGGYNFALVRYNLDGTLDATFGGGDGKVTTDFAGAFDFGQALAVQSDGRIVVAGYSDPGTSAPVFALARYHADGTLDASALLTKSCNGSTRGTGCG